MAQTQFYMDTDNFHSLQVCVQASQALALHFEITDWVNFIFFQDSTHCTGDHTVNSAGQTGKQCRPIGQVSA